jgi:HEAT repeat protein
VTMTGSDYPTTRAVALIAAASIDPEKAFPYVSSALHDEALQVRLTAVTALGRIQTEESVAKLSSILSNPSDAAVRAAALSAVAEACVPPSVEILLQYMAEPSLAGIAAEGLKKCHEGKEKKIGSLLMKTGNSAVRSSLLQVISSDPSTSYLDALLSVRDKVGGLETSYLQCLEGLPDRRALIAMLSFTEHKNEAVRLAALEGADGYFERFGYDGLATDVIINSLSDGAEPVRKEALDLAARWKIKETAALMKSFLKATVESERTSAAALLLILGEHAADDIVIGGLFSFDAGVRRSSVETLLQSPPACSDGVLDSTVRSQAFFDRFSPGVFERFIAAGSILKSCEDAEGTALVKTLVEGSNEEEASLGALASVVSSRPVLLAAVEQILSGGNNTHTARDLSTRLWLASGEGGVHLLKQLLASPDAFTRSGAVLSLTRTQALGEEEKAEILLKMLDDDFAGVRVNAMAGLAALPQKASARGDEICKKLDRHLDLPETLGALKLLSAAGAGCMDEKLGRLTLSHDKTIMKSAVKAAELLFGGDTAGPMPDRLRFALASCARNDPDKEIKQLCAGLSKTGPLPHVPAGKPLAIAAAGMVSVNIKKGPAPKGNVTASRQILPFEYSIAQLDPYPRYYPFYFITADMEIVMLFKNSLCFSGMDFDASESTTYLDALNKS